MRFLLTVGVLLVTAVLASAIYRPNPFKPTDLAKLEAKLLNLRRSTGNHFVQKRQSSACIDAYLETQSQRFQECSQLLGDGGNITTTELIEFCHHDDCVSLLIKVFTDLENCDAVDTNTTQQVIQLVKFFCTTNSNGDYCLELQDNFYNGILRPPTSDIESCDFTTAATIRCSNSCKNVAEWIKSKLGCCYVTFEEAYLIPDEYLVPSGFFENCGQQITAC